MSLAGDSIGQPAIYICPHRVVPPCAHTTPRRPAPSAPSTPSAPHTTSPAVTPPTATPILSHRVRGPRHLPSPATREYSFPVTLATPHLSHRTASATTPAHSPRRPVVTSQRRPHSSLPSLNIRHAPSPLLVPPSPPTNMCLRAAYPSAGASSPSLSPPPPPFFPPRAFALAPAHGREWLRTFASPRK